MGTTTYNPRFFESTGRPGTIQVFKTVKERKTQKNEEKKKRVKEPEMGQHTNSRPQTTTKNTWGEKRSLKIKGKKTKN